MRYTEHDVQLLTPPSLPSYNKALPVLPFWLGHVPSHMGGTAVWVLHTGNHFTLGGSMERDVCWEHAGLFPSNAGAHRHAQDEAIRWGRVYATIIVQTPCGESYPWWHADVAYFHQDKAYDSVGRLRWWTTFADDHRPDIHFPRRVE